MGCKDSPAYILDQTVCLYEISKETTREDRAELRRVLLDQEECRERECKTLKTIHQLELPLRGVRQREGCDHPLAERLHLDREWRVRHRHAVRHHQRGHAP